MRHLSDDLIQQYLDTPELSDKGVVENHLLVCLECQEKMGQYQDLYQHLSVESETVLDESINLNVLTAVARIESKQKSRRQIIIAGALSGVTVLVLSLNYFGLISWPGLLSAVKSTWANVFNPFRGTVSLLVEKLNGNLELLAFAGLVLLLFQLLDRGLLQHKVKRT